MKIKNSIKDFNESVKSSNLEIKKNSNRSFNCPNDLQSIKQIRKFTESLYNLESRSSFENNNLQFVFNEYKIPKNIYTFLEYSFLSLYYLISKPLIEITPDKIVLTLFCFKLNKNKANYNNQKLFSNNNKELVYLNNSVKAFDKIERIKLRIISLILRKLFKKTVELEIIRLHYPFYEANIFVNLLSKTINKFKLKRVLSKFFKKANIFKPVKLIGRKISKIPSFVSGIKIRIAGR